MKKLLIVAAFMCLVNLPRLSAQDPLDGLWQGYDGEWRHVSNQLIALAEATPADKFAWRPAPGVISSPGPAIICASHEHDVRKG